jgi:phosphopantothenoylcysteine synthetase/decarboxylase
LHHHPTCSQRKLYSEQRTAHPTHGDCDIIIISARVARQRAAHAPETSRRELLKQAHPNLEVVRERRQLVVIVGATTT